MPEKWSTLTFYQEIENLEKMVKQEADPMRKDYLQMVLDTSANFYFDNFLISNHPRITEQGAMCNLASSVLAGGRYYSVIESYFYSLEDVMQKGKAVDTWLNKRMHDNYDLKALANTHTTQDQAISSLLKYYAKLDEDLNKTFRFAFDNSYLNFNRRHDNTLPSGSDGRTYFIDGVQKNFVSIMDTKNAQLVTNLVHEYGHAIRNIISPEWAYTCENDFFAEVASLFPELVSYEENPGEYPKLIVDYLKYDTFREYCDYSLTIAAQPYIYQRWKDNFFRINRRLKKELLQEDSVDSDIYDKALTTDITENGSYVLSYITALELLHIYREDKKEALKLFKKILELKPTLTYLGEVNRIVPLNVHATQETEKIVDDLCLSLTRRG
jgi:hypothetical protein